MYKASDEKPIASNQDLNRSFGLQKEKTKTNAKDAKAKAQQEAEQALAIQQKQEAKKDDDLLKTLEEFHNMFAGSSPNEVDFEKLKQIANQYSGPNVKDKPSSIQIKETRDVSPSTRNIKAPREIRNSRVKEPIIKENPIIIKKDNTRAKSQLASRPSKPLSDDSENALNKSQNQETYNDNDEEEEEEVEIDDIKQNLLNIQDNLHILKQSFKDFQSTQSVPKSKLAFMETPKKEQPASKNEAKPSPKSTALDEQRSSIKREQKTNSLKPSGPSSPIIKSPIESKGKAVSAVIGGKSNYAQGVVIPSDGSSYLAKKMAQNSSRGKQDRQKDTSPLQSDREYVSTSENNQAGNMSFSGTDQGECENYSNQRAAQEQNQRTSVGKEDKYLLEQPGYGSIMRRSHHNDTVKDDSKRSGNIYH